MVSVMGHPDLIYDPCPLGMPEMLTIGHIGI